MTVIIYIEEISFFFKWARRMHPSVESYRQAVVQNHQKIGSGPWPKEANSLPLQLQPDLDLAVLNAI